MLLTTGRSALRTAVARGMATGGVRTKVTLPDLDWDFGALEPHISGQINEVSSIFVSL
jgi:Fe-Mn family superoxide dismutase